MRALLVLLLLVGAWLAARRCPAVAGPAGLEPALALLAAGAQVAPQYHAAMLGCLRMCADAYGASFVAPAPPQRLLEELVVWTGRAVASAQELAWRCPVQPGLERRLEAGRDLLADQLHAWQAELRARTGAVLNGREGPEWDAGL